MSDSRLVVNNGWLGLGPGDDYLPIRTIETAPGESVPSDRAIRDDYKWLPDTAANLSLLTPAGAIPAGFTQVPNAGAGN